MTVPLRRRLMSPAIVLLFATVGCSSHENTASAEPAPAPSGKQADHCRALHKELPATVNGMKRRVGNPEFVASWGKSPAITLRCGVPKPLILMTRPASATVEIDDVEWMPEQQPDGSVRVTTSKREAWVEVTIPKEYAGGAGDGFGMLDVLSDAVGKAIPYGMI
ncbi:DUF3515 domain-containing protein [Streptomyces sp. NPDC002537]